MKTPAARFDTRVGVNLSVLAGLDWVFWRGMGLFLEGGWTFHWVRHAVETGYVQTTGEPLVLTLKLYLHQAALNLGLFYRF